MKRASHAVVAIGLCLLCVSAGEPPSRMDPNVEARLDEVAELRARMEKGDKAIHLRIEIAEKELMAMATLVEAYTMENKAWYPGLARVLGDFANVVKGEFDPAILERMPAKDPWGRPYLYWTRKDGYFFVSLGPDGKPAADYTTWGDRPGPSNNDCPGDDILAADGSLCYRR